MKRILFSFVLILFILSGLAYSQAKIGYIDSDAIMEKLPDAQDARQKLDALVQEWQGELNKIEANWKTKYDDYEKRKLIMTEQTRAETEAELVKLERAITDYREKKFGTNGEMFQKQDELMKPVQNKIFSAVKEIALEDDYDYVFDKSGDILLIYTKEKYDITAKVLNKLKQ